ncbi:MAG TPA: response regulator [Rubrobacteraceae bacterium]|nr:response regulator [Rubrobacteraceae bacterium]
MSGSGYSPNAEPRLAAEGSRGYRALVIDDDDKFLALARLSLAKNGVQVQTAATAADGLALLNEDPPDLVILDVVMPDLLGWEVLRRIRAASDVPVMLLSGRDSDVDKARGLDLGADDYLTKPFSFMEFEARVRALLRRQRISERYPPRES